MLALWRRLLAPGGTLIVADVIPPHVGALSDGLALLRYAAANGFLGAALLGLTRTALSRYRRLRSELGIARYERGGIPRRSCAPPASPPSGCRATSSTIRRA